MDPAKSQMCHWIATNITTTPSSSVKNDDSGPPIVVTDYETLVPYLPPTPPPRTGYHRYIFVLFSHHPDKDYVEPVRPGDRSHWGYGKVGGGVREWAEEYNLVVIGESSIQ